jgi:HSP20 family protein
MSDQLQKNPTAARAERMTPWTPFRDLFGFDPFQPLRSTWGIDGDVTRTETGYEVELPVPGFKPEEVEVTFHEGVISVNAKRERRSFSRSFTVPEDVNPEKIQARVSDGMLILTLDRRPEAQPRRIAVK